jgi:hypothetical protein
MSEAHEANCKVSLWKVESVFCFMEVHKNESGAIVPFLPDGKWT